MLYEPQIEVKSVLCTKYTRLMSSLNYAMDVETVWQHNKNWLTDMKLITRS